MSDPLTIEQYCSVCKMEYDMSIIPTADGDDDGVVWLQCPNCKGYLPKISSSPDLAAVRGDANGRNTTADTAADTTPKAETGTADPDSGDQGSKRRQDETFDRPLAGLDTRDDGKSDPNDDPDRLIGGPSVLDDMDIETGVPYRPWESYTVGDVIHHLAWDDYGVVIGKEVLPGDRKIVKVHFSNTGIVRLIEEDGERP